MTINDALLKRLHQSIVIEHPIFTDVLHQALSYVQSGPPGKILAIVGPTGVGKTTLLQYCVYKLNEYIEKYPDNGRGKPISIEAHTPENGKFSWRTLYHSALEEMSEPAIQQKIIADRAIEKLRAGIRNAGYASKITTAEMRELYLDRVSERRPIAVFIDEVHSISKAASSLAISNNLEIVKGLSNRKNTNYILMGTYEARNMLYHGAQLSRRIEILNFRRYTSHPNDMEIFSSICDSIFSRFEIPVSREVVTNYSYLYNHSLGCVGILMDWLCNAILQGMTRKANVLTRQDFERSRLQNIQLSAIAKEIAEFEIEHESRGEFNSDDFFSKQSFCNRIDPTHKNSKKGRRRPGLRNPQRDVVGDLLEALT